MELIRLKGFCTTKEMVSKLERPPKRERNLHTLLVGMQASATTLKKKKLEAS
jgi:hypothetical protein